MEKVIRLTETDLTRIVKRVISENLGVNNDVKTISNFLFDKIKTFRPGTHTITKNDLPNLEVIDISKLIINITSKNYNSGIIGGFNVSKSKKTNDGIVGYFHFNGQPSKNIIAHEATHLLQFDKLGYNKTKIKHQKDLTLPRVAKDTLPLFTGKLSDVEKDIFEDFFYLLYLSTDDEIFARVTQLYPSIESLKQKNKPYEDVLNNADNVEDKNFITKYLNTNSVENTIKNSGVMSDANKLINYDIFKEFGRISEEKTILFFSLIKHFEKDYSNHQLSRMVLGIKTILKYLHIKFLPQSVIIISEDQTLSLMKKYNDKFKTQGEKLKRKLYRLASYE